MKKSQKLLFVFIIFILVFTLFGYYQADIDEGMEIYDKTLRLHIPANSDSEQDQALKLKVRDEVIRLLEAPLSDCKYKNEAVEVVENMRNEIKQAAEQVIYREGFDYTASVSIVEENYPRREYEGISLPAGKYTSVKIELGTAEGQNWWCVLFPQVCTSGACPEQVLKDVGFTASQIKLLTEEEETEYVVKFKLVEFIQNILN